MSDVFTFILNLVVRRFLIRFVGLNVRFFFFRIFGKKITKKELSFNKNQDEYFISQDLINAVVGLVCIGLLISLLTLIP